MHLTHFRSGPLNPEREARMCGHHYVQPPDNPVERGAVAAADWINGVWEQLFNPDETTRKNMKDHGLWINAFRDENMFTIPQDASRGRERCIGPEQFLLSLDSEHRQIELLRYAQGVIPAVVRKEYPDVFAVPGIDVILDDKLNNAVDALHKVGKKVDVNDRSRRIIVDALREIMGDEISGHDDDSVTAHAIAMETLNALYPQGGKSARAYFEYQNELKNLSDDKQPVPDVRLLRQPQYLKLIRTSTLKGALKTGVIAERDLEVAALTIERADVEKEKAKDEARKKKEKITGEDRKKLEAEGKSISENFSQMWEKHPLIVMGLIGIGLWKGKEMLTSKGRFLGIVPHKWIMWSLIGTFGYLGFIKGDENPFETMGNAAKGLVDNTARWTKDRYNKVRGIANSHKETLDRSELVARFLDKKTYKFMQEAMVGFGALEQVRLEAVARSFELSANGRGGILRFRDVDENQQKKINEQEALVRDLKAKGAPVAIVEQAIVQLKSLKNQGPKSLLSISLDGLAKKEKINSSAAYRFLEDNNEKVSDALAEFFLVLGGEQPGKGPIMEEIEAARKKRSEKLGRIASYDDIDDPEIRHKIIVLATEGKALCTSGTYASKTFIDVIEDIVHRSEGKDRTIDNADRIANYRDERVHEFKLHDNMRLSKLKQSPAEIEAAKREA